MSRHNTRPRRVALAALALSAIAGCGADAPTVAAVPDDVGPVTADPRVTVDDNVFEPAEVVVATDTTVTWTWHGRAAHDVVGPDFDSGVLTDGSFAHTFTSPGSYTYTCELHAGMDGVIHVVEG